MDSLRDLAGTLRRIDGKGYGAYKDIKGSYEDGALALHVDHVQGDPFATPSKLRLTIEPGEHGIPGDLWDSPVRAKGLCDYLLRVFAAEAKRIPKGPGNGKSGAVQVDDGDAEVLLRSGCSIDAQHGLEVRFRVGLPAKGRNVLGRAAAELLTERLPDAMEALWWEELDEAAVRAHVDLVEDHAYLQQQLAERGLIAFIRDESVLPRASGISSKPMTGAVPFRSPESLRVTLPTQHHGEVTGLGIPEGVTLITGGGFHGKTTLLEAIQAGVYPHIPGDGREWVVTRDDAMKVRSEDGRAIAGVDLRPFIRDLPGDTDTSNFVTEDASGSTSLAAAILESIEAGATTLLLDEDTCATNLLIRDARMQALVQRETITPLLDRVRELYDSLGVSTLLVLGGNGDYLDVADRVLLMEAYEPHEVTARATEVAASLPTQRSAGESLTPLAITARCPQPESFDPRRGNKDRVRSRGLREIEFGEETIDLSSLDQLVDTSQARAIGTLIRRLKDASDSQTPLRDAVNAAYQQAIRDGLYALDPTPELALPRPHEIQAAVNRLRSLRVTQQPG